MTLHNLFDVINEGGGEWEREREMLSLWPFSLLFKTMFCVVFHVDFIFVSHRIVLWMFYEWQYINMYAYRNSTRSKWNLSHGWHSDNRITSFCGCAMSAIDINIIIFRLFHIKITIKFYYLCSPSLFPVSPHPHVTPKIQT